jgi:hypothetical protein
MPPTPPQKLQMVAEAITLPHAAALPSRSSSTLSGTILEQAQPLGCHFTSSDAQAFRIILAKKVAHRHCKAAGIYTSKIAAFCRTSFCRTALLLLRHAIFAPSETNRKEYYEDEQDNCGRHESLHLHVLPPHFIAQVSPLPSELVRLVLEVFRLVHNHLNPLATLKNLLSANICWLHFVQEHRC